MSALSAKGFATKAIALALVVCFSSWREASADTGSYSIETVLDATIHNCNACTSAQAQSMAQSLGSGAHYVQDLSNNYVDLLRVDCEPGVNGALVCSVSSRPVPPEITQAFNEYRSAWLANAQRNLFYGVVHDQTQSGGLVNPDGKPSDNGYVNAYDTIYHGASLNGLLQRLEDPLTHSGPMALLVTAINDLPAPFSWADLEITVLVQFNDGSQRRFHCDKHTAGFVAIPDTAIDAHDNTLPESTPIQLRSYSFRGLPTLAPYDSRNIVTLFPVGSNPDGFVGACVQWTWDGRALHCMRPAK